jgi:hypothetical protein
MSTSIYWSIYVVPISLLWIDVLFSLFFYLSQLCDLVIRLLLYLYFLKKFYAHQGTFTIVYSFGGFLSNEILDSLTHHNRYADLSKNNIDMLKFSYYSDNDNSKEKKSYSIFSSALLDLSI